MYPLKNQSASCPTTRPSTPSSPLASSAIPEKSRPLIRAPLSFRHSPPATPPKPAPFIPDGSYLEALGLRLSEAVSKALAPASGPALPNELLNGRRPIPTDRGRVLGTLIASELQAARGDDHLYKAILRALHKPLSVLMNNLSALLSPLLSSPAFRQPSTPSPNATQLHALAIADLAGELLSSFDDLALGIDTDSRGDGLKSIRTGLLSVVNRVIAPLMTGIKEELIPLVDALEAPAEATSPKAKGSVHPSIIALRSSVPIYGRALVRYTRAHSSQTLLASFLISAVWRALVALSHRPIIPQCSAEVTLAEKGQCPLGILSVSSTAGLFNLKRTPLQPASRIVSTSAVDARALCEIFAHFPRPAHAEVAREAVDEAFVHLGSLTSLLEILDNPFFGVDKTVEEITDEIYDLTDELPTLIALPVVLRVRYFASALDPPIKSVATLLNVSEETYRRDCLAGFGRAEGCGPVVAQRILDVIYGRPLVDLSEPFVGWLEARLSQNGL